jgi:hypothetical protein
LNPKSDEITCDEASKVVEMKLKTSQTEAEESAAREKLFTDYRM